MDKTAETAETNGFYRYIRLYVHAYPHSRKQRLQLNPTAFIGILTTEMKGDKPPWRSIPNSRPNQLKIDTNLLYSPMRGIYEDTTKTGTVRFVKIPVETMDLLREYRAWYDDLREANGDRWHDTDFLFVKDNGEPMIPDSITAWLRKFSMRHDLPHINPHAFRHTMASILINSGADVVSVSKRLGHKKVSTTTDIYSHIIQEADEQASECLADVILRPKK